MAIAHGYNGNAMKVSIAEARNRFTELTRAAENGEPVTVCRRGKPVVEWARANQNEKKKKIRLGLYEDLIREWDESHPDWWKPMTEEEVAAFLAGRY